MNDVENAIESSAGSVKWMGNSTIISRHRYFR